MPSESQDWINGFLVVGNQPVLDLLNTRLLAGDEEQEMLTDTSALVRWMQTVDLAAPVIASRLEDWSEQPEARSFLNDLVIFRELLCSAVCAFEDGREPSIEFVTDLNARLAAHPFRIALNTTDSGNSTIQVAGTSIADTLWAALLMKCVRLFTESDPARVRKCEGCVVHFQDTSKKNSRRWCSMRLCGNRMKVAAYQLRQRLAPQ